MYTAALLALAPIAAQAAAQSARWPVFNLRANVTEQYTGYTQNSRAEWHNAPIGQSAEGAIGGPRVLAFARRHERPWQVPPPPIWKCQNPPLISGRPLLPALPLLLESHFNWQVRALGDDGRQQAQDEDCAKEPG
jgi:hypothetical protein